MQFSPLQLVFATFLVPFTTALQTIYLATLASSGGNNYLAFFSDSNPCTDGTRFGYLPVGFDNCNQDITILGHENITFTGCKPYTGYPGTLPTGVADDGTPALKCKPASNPPGSLYGLYASCEPDANNDNVGGVSLLEYCS
ncbi:MAG: hypothetical protein ALECFALPRED_006908 [Alectoria fallacina]|uniref:Uncharacterized protein n=1 Tax=Alectoria fallacina TaxID=1903189 RepID=A0A8H3J019_9LECA|nr:MAG: hypothetical protein ALECFALPRED_006908 [Alectoria fallacina]